MHKTVFMWFNNLLTSTELQRFYYYQGKKIQSAATVFLSLKKHDNNKTLITKLCFLHPTHKIHSQWATKQAKNFSAQAGALMD